MTTRAWLILASIALARLAFGYQIQSVASLGPDLASRYALDYATLGTLIGAYSMAGLFAALPLGFLGDRFGERLIVGGGLVLMAGAGALPALVLTPTSIGASRFVAGMGAVAMIVMQGKIIADRFTGRSFLLAISISVCAFPVGISAAQLVLPPLAGSAGVATAFLSTAIVAAVSAALFLASWQPAAPLAVPTKGFSLPSGRECLLVSIAALAWTAYTGGYAGFVSYTPSLLSVMGAGAGLTALTITLATLGNVPGTLATPRLVARLGEWPVLAAGAVASAVGCILVAAPGWPLLGAALFGVIGPVQASIIVATGTLSARPENRAVGMGLFYTVYYAGNAVAPALCGWAADRSGNPGAALMTAGFFGLLALPAFALHRALQRRTPALAAAA